MASKAKQQDQVLVNDDMDGLDFLFSGDVGPDDSDLWQERYKIIQWNNEEKHWEFPLKHWAGTFIEQNFDVQDILHNMGQATESGMLVPEISLSVLSYRTTWETYQDDKVIYSPKPGNDGKWSKRYNFLVMLKVEDWVCDEPCVVTIKGHTGAFLESGLNGYRKKMIQAGLALSGNKMPGYVYWCALIAGDAQLVGKKEKSKIYPPTPLVDSMTDLDNEAIAVLLRTAYIGKELHERIKSALFDEAESWRTEHINAPQLGSGEPESKEVTVFGDGVLLFPDLSRSNKETWLECAMSIPGLFNHSRHAGNALGKVLGKVGYSAPKADQWEAFRTDLERRYNEANPVLDEVQLRQLEATA